LPDRKRKEKKKRKIRKRRQKRKWEKIRSALDSQIGALN
jgi:hypothetical protein